LSLGLNLVTLTRKLILFSSVIMFYLSNQTLFFSILKIKSRRQILIVIFTKTLTMPHTFCFTLFSPGILEILLLERKLVACFHVFRKLLLDTIFSSNYAAECIRLPKDIIYIRGKDEKRRIVINKYHK
jgi:hypothetical protein